MVTIAGRRRDDAAAVHGPLQGQREAGDHHALARGQHALLLLHASRYSTWNMQGGLLSPALGLGQPNQKREQMYISTSYHSRTN